MNRKKVEIDVRSIKQKIKNNSLCRTNNEISQISFYKKIQPKIMPNNDKQIRINKIEIKKQNISNDRNSVIFNKSTAIKHKNEISILSDITKSTRKENNISSLIELKERDIIPDSHNTKSRNQRVDSFLKSNNITDKSFKSHATMSQPKSIYDNKRTVDITLYSKNKNSLASLSKDKIKLTNNYNILKEKLDKLKTNIESRNGLISKDD
jgi:hypothetical protein